jgi:hypothetical protein
MIDPFHDDIVRAFQLLEPSCRTCDRAGPNGYTHIHGPNRSQGAGSCTNHVVVIEKTTGAVSLREPLAYALGASPRTTAPISLNAPTGFSAGPQMGHFSHGWDKAMLLTAWPHPTSFALVVIAAAQVKGLW